MHREVTDPSQKEPTFQREKGLWTKDGSIKQAKKNVLNSLDNKMQLMGYISQAASMCKKEGIRGTIRVSIR